ncbi:MAG: hypothetical protein QNL62_17555 [Gammaproteobacteria bacterium]|nr:hypothetical protein [Gammaproteobacteria bacterium]
MNNKNVGKSSITMAKSFHKDNLIRSEESLVRAANILKSLSNWGKKK